MTWIGFLAFLKKNWRWIATLIGIIIVVVILVFAYRGCNPKVVTFNEQEINKAQQAIRQQDEKAMREVLEQSDKRVAEADAKIRQAEANTALITPVPPQDYSGASAEELQAEIDKRFPK